jgi:hypothetical protein
MDDLKTDFKYTKKESKVFCAEFENLYRDSGFKIEEKFEEQKSPFSRFHTTAFREDFVDYIEEIHRKSSILRRLESNHSAGVSLCK